MNIALRYAARSDVGLVRSNNQDSGYAGPHLLVVADGMGGHAGATSPPPSRSPRSRRSTASRTARTTRWPSSSARSTTPVRTSWTAA